MSDCATIPSGRGGAAGLPNGSAGAQGHNGGAGVEPGSGDHPGAGGTSGSGSATGTAGANGTHNGVGNSVATAGGGGGYGAGKGATNQGPHDCGGASGGGGGASWTAAGAKTVVYSAGAAGGGTSSGGGNGTITLTFVVKVVHKATTSVCTSAPESLTLPSSGTWTASLAGGGGAAGLVTNGKAGTDGAGGNLSVNISGLAAGAHLAAVAGCQAIKTTGGVGFSSGGSSGVTDSGCAAYDAAVVGLGDVGYWELNGTSVISTGSTVPDYSGNTHTAKTGSGSITGGQKPGPINCNSSNPGTKFSGAYVKYPTGSTLMAAPQTFTYSAWFKTSSGGDIIDFFKNGTCSCTRALWVGASGHLEWGTWKGGEELVTSPQVVNDSIWHNAVATIGPAGMTLYLDGNLVASNPSYKTSTAATGQFYVGGGFTPWNDHNGASFTGTLGRVAVVARQLTAKQVTSLYADAEESYTLDSTTLGLAGTGAPGVAGAYWELNTATGSSTAVDATVANGNAGNPGTWTGGTDKPTTGPWKATLTGKSTAAIFSGSDYVATSATHKYSDPQTMTVTAWFKTTSSGGILGFGTKATTASNYDRLLWVDSTGHLVWGTCGTPCVNEVKSTGSVTDGQWHFVAATIGASGKYLYLDGNLVGETRSTTLAQNFSGVWKIGSLTNDGGWTDTPTSLSLAGDIGRVAYIPNVLSANTIKTLYADGGFVPAPSTCTAYTDAVRSLAGASSAGADWPLNDTGTTLADLSGNQDLGSVVTGSVTQGSTAGPIQCSTGAAQYATTFGGAAYVTTPNKSKPATTSVVAWIKTSHVGPIIAATDNGTGGTDLYMYVGSDHKLHWATYKTAAATINAVVSPSTVNTNKWTMVVGTIGPKGMALYLNGNMVASGPDTTPRGYATDKWVIGKWLGGTWGSVPGTTKFNGSLSNVAVIPSTLSAKQVRSLYSDAGYTASSPVCSLTVGTPYDGAITNDSPLAYWKLADRAGNIAADDNEPASTANINALAGTLSTGTIVAGGVAAPATGPLNQCPAASTGGATSNGGGALTFKGTGDFTTSNTMAANANSLTQMVWVKSASAGATNMGGIMGLNGPSEFDHFLWIGKNGKVYYEASNSATYLTSDSNKLVNTGSWHLITVEVVLSGTHAGTSIYVDGSLVGFRNINTSVSSASKWTIGGMATATPGGCSGTTCPNQAYFNGTMSRAVVMNTQLTAAQMRQFYRLATGNSTTATDLGCPLNAYEANVPVGNPTAMYVMNTASSTTVVARPTTSATFKGTVAKTTKMTFDKKPGPAACFTAGGALDFKGNTKTTKVTLGTKFNTAYNPTTFTVGSWFRMNSGWGNNARIIANTHTDSTKRGFQLEVNSGGKSGFFDVGHTGSKVATATWSITPGISSTTWYFYVGVFNGATGTVTAYLYKPTGTLLTTATGTTAGVTAMKGQAKSVTLGLNPKTTGTELQGWLADAAIYTVVEPEGFLTGIAQTVGASLPSAVSLKQTVATDVAATSSCQGYDGAVLGLGPSYYWEMSGTTPTDASGSANTGTMSASAPSTGVSPGPLPCATTFPAGGMNGSPAMKFTASSSQYIYTAKASNPRTLSIAAWFKTTSTKGGGIAAFSATASPAGGANDRDLWLDNTGNVVFGAGSEKEAVSPLTYNNGMWHYAVGTIGASGMVLYVDGKQVATTANKTTQSFTGYWDIGTASDLPTSTWGHKPTNEYFTGSIGRVAIFPYQLSALQMSTMYSSAFSMPQANPTPSNTCSAYDADVLAEAPTAYWEMNTTNNSSYGDYAHNFATISPLGAGNVQEMSPGPLQCLLQKPGDTTGWAGSFAGTNYETEPQQYNNPQTFSIVVWFAAYGDGGIVGFQSSTAGSYDRLLYVGNDGDLHWGTYTGATHVIGSSNSILDGQWHMAVATISASNGMQLYLTGQSANIVAGTATAYSNGYDHAQAYNGVWTLGGWGHAAWGTVHMPSNGKFLGDMGRAAVIPSVLSATQVKQLYGESLNGLGGGGGGSSALCLEATAGATTCSPLQPACTSASTTPCLLAVTAGGGGGGSAWAGCSTTSGINGGDGGPLYYLNHGSATGGTYITGNGAGNVTGTGATAPGLGAYSTGQAGQFGVPMGSGGGGGGFAGGVGGSNSTHCGGAGGSTWFASGAPGSLSFTVTGAGSNVCTTGSGTTAKVTDDCAGSVTLTGPINAVSYSVTLSGTRPVSVGSVTWVTGK